MAYSATAYQLTHVLQNLYRRLGGKVTLATGGSTSTAIDTKLADELEDGNQDDIYNGGTLIVIEDAGGANAAPEGELSRITDYVASTTTLTLSPAVTAIASGDRILIAGPEFPLYDMIEVVNDALRDIGDVPKYDTSITTADSQTEYTLPVAVKGAKIISVEIPTTTDTNDNQWKPVAWREGFSAAGSSGTLILPQLSSGYTVRIGYHTKHIRVSGYADYIDEYFHPRLVDAAVFVHALKWRNSVDALAGGRDQEKTALEQQAWSEYERARAQYMPELPPKQNQAFPTWGL